MCNIKTMSDEELEFELNCLRLELKKASSLCNDIETEMVGLKEEIRRRQELKSKWK